MKVEFKDFVIQHELIRLMSEEIRALHDRHYRETELSYLKHPMAPKYDRFAQLESMGAFVCYTVREILTGRMVGYLMYFVNESLHGSYKTAQEDAYYVAPEHRGSGIARQLLRNAERDLAIHGVDYAFMSSKKPVGGPNIGLLLESEGYREVAHVYCKKLEA